MMWDASRIPDLEGRVAIVTGGNAGIGYETVKQLALRGAKVYVAARSQAKATASIDHLLKENKTISSTNLVWLPLDLSSLESVTKAAHEFCSAEKRLDILVNNGGTAAEEFQTTKEGFEMTMAVNHIGHWTFTYCLLDVLKSTASQKDSDVRVVTVSSVAESMAPKDVTFTSPKDLQNPCSSNPSNHSSKMAVFQRYGLSKLANILFASELQRRMDAEGINIISISLNPGATKTDGGLGVMPGFVRPIARLFFSSPEKAALTSLFAATAFEVRDHKQQYAGKFLNGPGKVKEPSERARSADLAKKLWDLTKTAVEEKISLGNGPAARS